MAVYEHDPVNTQSDENKTVRRYANLLRKSLSFDSGENISNVRWFFSWNFWQPPWGQPPFCMDSAAACIEDLANNVYGRFPILDVTMPGSSAGHSTLFRNIFGHCLKSWGVVSCCQVHPKRMPCSGPWSSVSTSGARTGLGSCPLHWTSLHSPLQKTLFDSYLFFQQVEF